MNNNNNNNGRFSLPEIGGNGLTPEQVEARSKLEVLKQLNGHLQGVKFAARMMLCGGSLTAEARAVVEGWVAACDAINGGRGLVSACLKKGGE